MFESVEKKEKTGETDKAFKHNRIKKDVLCVFLTIFVTGDRNVVDGSEFETGAGQDLELHRT